MEERKAFGWAFIGTGTLAKQVAKEITASGRHRIAAVYTSNPEKCRAFAEKYGAIAAGSAKEAILAESRYVPHKATLEVMEILDECRRQMGLVYPFD